jgi:hypothetical protein
LIAEENKLEKKFLLKTTSHGIPIGDNILSVTSVPNKGIDPDGKIYWDCPGFEDTNGS